MREPSSHLDEFCVMEISLLEGVSREPALGARSLCARDGLAYRTYAVALSGCGQFSAGFGEVSC